MQTHDAATHAVLVDDIGSHGSIENLYAEISQSIELVAREATVDAVNGWEVKQRSKLTRLGVANEQAIAHVGVAHHKVAVLAHPVLVAVFLDGLVRKLVENEVCGFPPRQIVTDEVDELVPVVAGRAAEPVGALFDDNGILASIHGFHGSSHTCQTTADDTDIRVIDLVAGRTAGIRPCLALPLRLGLRCSSKRRGTDRRSCASQHKPPARHISQCLCRILPVHNSPFVRLLRVDFKRGSTQIEAGYVTTMRGAPTYSSVRRRRKVPRAGRRTMQDICPRYGDRVVE